MKSGKFILCAAFMFGAAVLSFAGGSGEEGLDAIRKAGVLKVGVKTDVPKFGFLNTAENRYEGLEIELARLIAKEILDDADKVAFTPVTVKTRGPLLDADGVDLVIGTFTITEDRKLTHNFSAGYYTDAVGLLVKQSAGIAGIADCGGKIFGVAQSATSRKAIQEAADKLNLKIAFAEFASYAAIKAALDSGRIDIFAGDKSILNGYLDGRTLILPDSFTPQEYGVAGKLERKALARYVDKLIRKWLKDGTIDRLIKNFGL